MKRRPLLDRLVSTYPDEQRERLLSLILCGDVRVNASRIRDPRHAVSEDDQIVIVRERFVGRGGTKLDPALDAFGVDPSGLVVIDVGASTGGFTDCLLQRGARAVHAVDVGRNQLDYRLRSDDRVIVHERTNIASVESLDPRPDFAVVDVSFRSLRGIAAHILRLTRSGRGLFLIKPQFEWSDAPDSFDGVVPASEAEPIVATTVAMLRDEGVEIRHVVESPVRGRRGNREFFGDAWAIS